MTNGATATTEAPATTISGLHPDRAARIISILQERLSCLLDLQLTLKHIHWNVVGANFIAVHEFLDTQVAAVRTMSDDLAERGATLGGTPLGTPASIEKFRTWDDYGLGRASTRRHLAALDAVYDGVISDHRRAQDELLSLDPVTESMFIDQLVQLERFQWLVRAHLQDAGESTGRS